MLGPRSTAGDRRRPGRGRETNRAAIRPAAQVPSRNVRNVESRRDWGPPRSGSRRWPARYSTNAIQLSPRGFNAGIEEKRGRYADVDQRARRRPHAAFPSAAPAAAARARGSASRAARSTTRPPPGSARGRDGKGGRGKGTGPICGDGPPGAAYKLDQPPFRFSPLFSASNP